MRLYIIRHADPDYPNNTITPEGHKEAAVLAPRMAAERLDRIYCSPLGRAIDTAAYTAERTGLTPVIEPWSEEMAGLALDLPDWGRYFPWDLPAELVRPPTPFPGHDTWYAQPPFTERRFRDAFEQLRRDADAFLARHGYVRDEGIYRCAEPSTERIAMFCHDGFARAFIAHLLEIPVPLMWTGFWLPPSSVSTILFEERARGRFTPRCIGMGDVSHLYAAGCRFDHAASKRTSIDDEGDAGQCRPHHHRYVRKKRYAAFSLSSAYL